jgi:hypothetical protein
MQQKLLRKAGLLSILLTLVGTMLTSCINEPDPTIPPPMTSKVRFVNAISDAGKMDVWVDSLKVATDVSYKDITPYLTLHAGDRYIRLTHAGDDTSQAVYRGIFTIRSLTMNTMAFLGYLAGTSGCYATQERLVYADETAALVDSADVKLINLNVQIKTAKLEETLKTAQQKDSTVMRIDLSKYKDAAGNQWWLSSYVRMPIGDHKFTVIDENSAKVKEFDYTFTTKQRYTFIVVGTTGAADVLLLKDDVTVYSH